MNDKELLELAAKAAGLGEVWYLDGFDTPYIGKKFQIGRPIEYRVWNPLENDGTAFQLAFKLGFSVDMGAMIIGLGSEGEHGELEFENLNSSLDEVRRAIVRAAAEIGRAMP